MHAKRRKKRTEDVGTERYGASLPIKIKVVTLTNR